MGQLGVGTISRQDIILAAQPSGATALFLYSGEVSCNFTSTSGTSFQDQLFILIEPNPNITDPLNQIVGWGTQGENTPVPVVLPTSWNSNGGNTVVAINGPALTYISDASAPSGQPGLYIVATGTVQHGSLLSVQFQLSMRVKP